ncbi:hypothetical protein Scep_020447 [Stephania cephalantha]|uniref:Ecdysoneless n=1 Tax=Stephania cephalantha TaxID=152367 RepID=A0AAP0NN68_9MAGN
MPVISLLSLFFTCFLLSSQCYVDLFIIHKLALLVSSLYYFLQHCIQQHLPCLLSPNLHPRMSRVRDTTNAKITAERALPFSNFYNKLIVAHHLHDEWFVVYLLFLVSSRFPNLSIRVWDSDGDFLLIEAAYSLPRWINPDNSLNRVFIRNGEVHILPKTRFGSNSNPDLLDSLMFLVGDVGGEARASDSVQFAVRSRISGYPERARLNVHRVRVRVPASVAAVLKHEPCLVSLAVEGFYDRDIDSMKYAARMERFLPGGRAEELVEVVVRLSRAMYAQLVRQTFQAPKCYPMLPPMADGSAYVEAELGMKIACGFEMMYQQRQCDGSEVRGSSWDAYREELERTGYFKGLLPGSKEHRQLMETAQENYKNSSLFSRTSEMMNAPVRRIDEILALPHSADDFRGIELPPSDDDAWLYSGEDELNSAILQRQKEMEDYELTHPKSRKSRDHKDFGPSDSSEVNGFDPGDISKTMQAFIKKLSTYEGAEVPENRDSKDVDLDVERFFKDIESVMGKTGNKSTVGIADDDGESSSDMDFDDSEDGSDLAEDEERESAFMDTYSAALNKELKSTTLKKSFIRANEETLRNDDKGKSIVDEEMDEDFSPVDVDVNLVKSLLDSFSSQQGLPGPASNLLGLMGIQLPQDSNKDK